MVANDPDCKIELKTFHYSILNDYSQLKKETEGYQQIPVVRSINNMMVQRNYLQIKDDILTIVEDDLRRIKDDPVLEDLVIKKMSNNRIDVF